MSSFCNQLLDKLIAAQLQSGGEQVQATNIGLDTLVNNDWDGSTRIIINQDDHNINGDQTRNLFTDTSYTINVLNASRVNVSNITDQILSVLSSRFFAPVLLVVPHLISISNFVGEGGDKREEFTGTVTVTVTESLTT